MIRQPYGVFLHIFPPDISDSSPVVAGSAALCYDTRRKKTLPPFQQHQGPVPLTAVVSIWQIPGVVDDNDKIIRVRLHPDDLEMRAEASHWDNVWAHDRLRS